MLKTHHPSLLQMGIERDIMIADESRSTPFHTSHMCIRNTEPNEPSSQPQHDKLCASRYSISQLARIKPTSFVKSCLRAYGIDASDMDFEAKKNFFLGISEERIAAYDLDVMQAVRKGDIEYLRSVKKLGRSLQGCNSFGESIIHLACRRGSVDLVEWLVTEGCVSLRVSDDFGRTPLHDACWKKEPNFKLIDLILDQEPELLLVADKRGHLPFDYARTHHWGLWIQFLEMRMKKEIRNRLSSFK